MNLIVFAKEIGLGAIRGLGPLGNFFDPFSLLNKVISTIIGIFTVCAGIWFIFQFIIGAFSWLTAGSDKMALENAKKRILNAIIGLVVVISSIFIIDLVGTLLGLKILSPAEFIIRIWS